MMVTTGSQSPNLYVYNGLIIDCKNNMIILESDFKDLLPYFTVTNILRPFQYNQIIR